MRSHAALLMLMMGAGVASADELAVAVEAHVDVAVSVDLSTHATPSASAPAEGELVWSTPLARPHWEAAVAMALPLDTAGDIGLHVAAGRQLGGFRLALEYTRSDTAGDRPSKTGALMADCGLSQRIGVAARYRVGMGAPPVGFGAYLEGGAGRDEVSWSHSGTSVERDLMLGLGVELVGGGDRLFGVDIGARFVLAERTTTGFLTVGLIAGG